MIVKTVKLPRSLDVRIRPRRAAKKRSIRPRCAKRSPVTRDSAGIDMTVALKDFIGSSAALAISRRTKTISVTSDANALVARVFVALCDVNDSLHRWAIGQVKSLPGPWLTCEACITELDHLLDFLTPHARSGFTSCSVTTCSNRSTCSRSNSPVCTRKSPAIVSVAWISADACSSS